MRVGGKGVRTGSPRASLAAGVALLPEDRKSEGIVPTMSVRDNIALMALPSVSRWGFIAPRRIDRLVERVHRPARHQDGGRSPEHRAAVRWQPAEGPARPTCCAPIPRLLLLDEPTRGIDIGAKAEVQSLIQELADQGGGIVLISSELEDVVEGSTRVVVLNSGTVVGELGRDDIEEHRIMELMAAAPLVEEGTAPS